jgi:glycosyltransferase involved in cell wall biosynthesis
MAARVPVAATAVGGLPEIATHGVNALLMKPRDQAGMAHALGSLITDSERASRLAEAAYEHVRSGYAPEARVRKLIGIYRGLLAESGSVKG